MVLRVLTLQEKSGFLVLATETYATLRGGILPGGAVLRPLSDAEAIVSGIQHARTSGNTIRAIAGAGEELLAFGGYTFRKAR